MLSEQPFVTVAMPFHSCTFGVKNGDRFTIETPSNFFCKNGSFTTNRVRFKSSHLTLLTEIQLLPADFISWIIKLMFEVEKQVVDRSSKILNERERLASWTC